MNPLRWLARQLFEDDDALPGPEEMVRLARPDGQLVAGLWREMLQRQGIESLLKNAQPVSVYIGEYFGRYEVHVLQRDLERARDILGLPAE